MPNHHPHPGSTDGTGVDPDIDLTVPAEHREWNRRRELVPAIALGGMVGASARYALTLAIPTATGHWPWATLLINATGCFLLGLLMVWVAERQAAHPLARPFLGVGVLGGYTTFSTYAVEGHNLIETGHPLLGLTYLWVTVAVALATVTTGAHLARTIANTLHHHRTEAATAANKGGDR